MAPSTQNIRFITYDEAQLSWQQHHEIHHVLNMAYSHRTNAFANKTFSYFPPKKRILCYLDDKLVGHTAIFESTTIANKENTVFAGLGMTLSLKPFLRLGHELRRRALIVCRDNKYPFALGRIKNSERAKNNLADLVHCFLDIPLIGNSTQSHSWETLAIYNTRIKSEIVEQIIANSKIQKQLIITSEVF